MRKIINLMDFIFFLSIQDFATVGNVEKKGKLFAFRNGS